MVELREQLGALMRLEVKYSIRDYLLDLTSKDECDDSTTLNSGDVDNCIVLQDQISSTCEAKLPSARAATNVGDGGFTCNEESLPSSTQSLSAKCAVITEQEAVAWREKICEWSYQVADHFDLTRDLVYIALNYIDRVCASSDTVMFLRDKNRFQLLAMASLCLAIKLHGGMDIHVPGTESSIIETILHLGRDHYTAQQLKEMEAEALQRLQWCLNPPTPQTYVSYILKLFPVEETSEINDIALYIIELSVHDYYLVSSKPSVLALSALSNAARMLGHTDTWINYVLDELLRNHDYKNDASIEACKDRLDRLYANTGTKLEDFLDISSLERNNQPSPTSVVDSPS